MSQVGFHSKLVKGSIEKISRVVGDERQRHKEKELGRVQQGDGRLCRREGKEETKKDIHLAREQEGYACLEIGIG